MLDIEARARSGANRLCKAKSSVHDLADKGEALNDGEWHVGCGQFNGTEKMLWRQQDGRMVVSASATMTNNAGGGAERWGTIGDGSEAAKHVDFGGSRSNIGYEGDIASIAVWDRVLTAKQMNDWANNVAEGE